MPSGSARNTSPAPKKRRRPVISVNMTVAAAAVNECLARLYRIRNQPNGNYAITRINLAELEIETLGDGAPCPVFAPGLGAGDINPLLNLPELSD